jgi:hypothetical protein
MAATAPQSGVSPIRLLALDMDDTLLDRDLDISAANRRALAAAERRGVQVVLASGRAPAALDRYVRLLGMDRRPGYLIAFNGSQILESDTGLVEWEARLEPEILAQIWDLAESLGVPMQSYDERGILVGRDNPRTRRESERTGVPWRMVDRAEFLCLPRVKVLLSGEPAALDPVEAGFKAAFPGRANMYRSKPYYFEIMPPAADKGLALERLAGLHGIRREQVMAVGDSWNDEGMLRWAGVAVAMANGAEEVRRIATWVTTRGHQEDGVAEAVERFILRR